MERCHDCGQACYPDKYPEIVFRKGAVCICEDCSIDWEVAEDGAAPTRREGSR